MKTTDTRINVVKAASRYSEKYREVILRGTAYYLVFISFLK